MKHLIFVSIILFSIIIVGYQQVFALQQVAGKIEFNVAKGETKTAQWGLLSDYPDKITKVEIHAEGEGASFLSFPKSVEIGPQQVVFVEIAASIPDDYSGNPIISPVIIATEHGEEGGPTVINIQMKKIITLVISGPSPPPVPEVSTEMEFMIEEEGASESELTKTNEATEQPTTKEIDESICGEGTVFKDGKCIAAVTPPATEQSKGGGCLIATATYDSELAPQVQLLREIRDSVVFTSGSGVIFMGAFNSLYYSFSPTIADWERQNPVFKETVKVTVTPLLSTLAILNYVNVDSESEILGYGIGIILLNVGMYFVAPAAIIIKLRQKIKFHT